MNYSSTEQLILTGLTVGLTRYSSSAEQLPLLLVAGVAHWLRASVASVALLRAAVVRLVAVQV